MVGLVAVALVAFVALGAADGRIVLKGERGLLAGRRLADLATTPAGCA
ncbi:MAG: hypothetical protein R3F59_34095 [Myxococcota bacterium]